MSSLSLKRSRVSSDEVRSGSEKKQQEQEQEQYTVKKVKKKKTFFTELNARWEARMKNIRSDFIHNHDKIRTTYNMKFFKENIYFRFDGEDTAELKNMSSRLFVFETVCKRLKPSDMMTSEMLLRVASLSFLGQYRGDIGSVRNIDELLELRERDRSARREKIKEIIASQNIILFCSYTFFLPLKDDEILDLLSRQTTWTHHEWEVVVSSIYFEPYVSIFQLDSMKFQPFLPLWVNDDVLKNNGFRVWETLVEHAHEPRYLSLPDDKDLYELVCNRLFESVKQANPDLHLEIYPEFINTLAVFFFKVFTFFNVKLQRKYIPIIIHQYIQCKSFVEPFVKHKIFSVGKDIFHQSGNTSLNGWIKIQRQNVRFFIQQRGWIGSISQSVFDVDRSLTLADVLGYILEHKPSSLRTPVVSKTVYSFLSGRTPAPSKLPVERRQHVLKHAKRYYRQKDDDFFLYHGTDSDSAINIMKQPRRIGKGLLGEGLYTTPRYEDAMGYAFDRVQRRGGTTEPVLLEFRLSFQDASQFVFGEDFVINMRSSWRAQHLASAIGFTEKDILIMKDEFLRAMIEKMIPALYTHRTQSRYTQLYGQDDQEKEATLYKKRRQYEKQDSVSNTQRRQIISYILHTLKRRNPPKQGHQSMDIERLLKTVKKKRTHHQKDDDKDEDEFFFKTDGDDFFKTQFSALYRAIYGKVSSQSQYSQFHRVFHEAIEYVYMIYIYFHDIVFHRNDQSKILLRKKEDVKLSLERHMNKNVYNFLRHLFHVETLDGVLEVLYNMIVLQPRGHGQYIIIQSDNMLAKCRLSQVFRL